LLENPEAVVVVVLVIVFWLAVVIVIAKDAIVVPVIHVATVFMDCVKPMEHRPHSERIATECSRTTKSSFKGIPVLRLRQIAQAILRRGELPPPWCYTRQKLDTLMNAELRRSRKWPTPTGVAAILKRRRRWWGNIPNELAVRTGSIRLVHLLLPSSAPVC
jgi:hypothetical protein